MYLSLLGSPKIQFQGQPKKLYAKAFALLAYLALEGRTERRHLAGLFWGDSSDPLNNLSVMRAHIVLELGEEALISELETLELGTTIRVDVLDWQTETDLEKRFALYKGEFLSGVRFREWKRGLGLEFEEWLEQKRQLFITEQSELAFDLARLTIKNGQFEAALPLLELAAGDETEPREEALRLLLLVQGVRGETDKAVGFYTRFSKSLHAALGVEPTSQTKKVFELVRSGSKTTCENTLRQEMGLVQPRALVVVSQVPFVGRQDNLKQSLNFLRLEDSGNAKMLILQGEPGAGKSRLMQEILKHSQATRVLHSKATPETPIAEILAVFVRQALALEPNKLEKLSAPSRKAIESLLLEQSNQAVNTNEHFDLHKALCEVLLVSHQPTILALDDLQWADSTTILQLGQLLQHSTPHPLHLIATLRHTENSQANWQSLLEICLAEIIRLEPLSQTDLALLITHQKNTTWDSQTLRHMSGGNPLYALELLRSQNSNASQVSNLIRLRLQRLDSLEKQTLEGLAVLGGKHDLYTLQLVTARSPQELIESTEQLGYKGLLGDDQHGMHLNHDLTRAVLLEDMGMARKAMLHLRAARALKMPSVAAQHYWDARHVWTPRDRIQAHRAFQGLADRYSLHGDLDNAAIWFEHQIETSQDDKERLQVILKQADWYAKMSKHNEAFNRLEQADLLLGSIEDAVLHAYDAAIRAKLYIREKNNYTQAEHYAQTAIVRIRGLRNKSAESIRADAVTIVGLVKQNQGDLEQAQLLYTESLDIWQRLGNQSNIAVLLNCIAVVCAMRRNFDQAKSVWLQALEIQDKLLDGLSVAGVHNNLSTLEWQCGRYTQALEHIKKAESYYVQTNSVRLADCFENRGAILFLQGNFNESLQSYQQAIAVREQHQQNIKAELRLNLAEALYKTNKVEQAKAQMNLVWDDLGQNQRENTPVGLYAKYVQGEIFLLENNLNAAQKQLLEARVTAEKFGDVTLEKTILERLDFIQQALGVNLEF